MIIKKGTALVVVEAMKMEHVLRAPFDAIVEKISSQLVIGTLVQEGHLLLVLKPQ